MPFVFGAPEFVAPVVLGVVELDLLLVVAELLFVDGVVLSVFAAGVVSLCGVGSVVGADVAASQFVGGLVSGCHLHHSAGCCLSHSARAALRANTSLDGALPARPYFRLRSQHQVPPSVGNSLAFRPPDGVDGMLLKYLQ